MSIFTIRIHAQQKTQIIQIPALQSAFNTIIATIQNYLPLVIIAELVFLGLKLALSGEDVQTKNWVRTKGFQLIVGSVLIFGASYLTTEFLKIINTNP